MQTAAGAFNVRNNHTISLSMLYRLFIFLSVCFCTIAHAEEQTIALDRVVINPHNVNSIKRGAKFFATNCMSCHTLVYLRYDKLAQDSGITYEKMPINIKNWPNGITPPDLSLVADARGVDWLYTYFHSFYYDPTRPFGINNLLVHNTAMPNILSAFQGKQILAKDIAASKKILGNQLQWYDVLELHAQGFMTPDQYDAAVTDLVNFLAYAAAPYQVTQFYIGIWVIGFLILFLILAYFLKKEWWKDLKKEKKHP